MTKNDPLTVEFWAAVRSFKLPRRVGYKDEIDLGTIARNKQEALFLVHQDIGSFPEYDYQNPFKRLVKIRAVEVEDED